MPPQSEEPDYLAHAFKSEINVIGLATAAGFAVLSGTLLPVILAAGAELVLLPLISALPHYKRFVRMRAAHQLSTRQATRHLQESSQMLQHLPDRERNRYRMLQQLCADIRENYAGLDASSRVLVDELVNKLDFLLSFYLRMRVSLMRYREYFSTTDPERINERIAMLDREVQQAPPRIQQIKARTRSVLEKRLERYKRAHENQQLVEAQTETVEEVLQLLRDQSFAMSDPRSITEQLDGLVTSAEETERGVRDIEEILSMDIDAFAPGTLGDDVQSELEGLGLPKLSSSRPSNRSGSPPSRTPTRNR